MDKSYTLFFIGILITSIVVMVEFTFAQSISESLVPEFTLRYIDLSYYEPPTYGIDQFTGENVTVNEGRHVENRSVAFKIKNQIFSSYNDSSGNFISQYYNFRFKGHFGDEWYHYPFSESGDSTHRYSTTFYILTTQSPKLNASDSEYTDILLGLKFLFGAFNPSVGSQVDFQVQTLIGHIDYAGDGFYRYSGQRSDWSSTQTVTVGENQITPTPTPEPTATPSPTPTPTSTPTAGTTPSPTPTPTASPTPKSTPETAFDFPIEIAGIGIVAIIGVAVMVFFKRK